MDAALILSYKRIPKTYLYDSVVMKMPEREVLVETTAQSIEAALENLHLLLKEHPGASAGFKKHGVAGELTDVSGDLALADKTTTEGFREDLNKLLQLFRPMNVSM